MDAGLPIFEAVAPDVFDGVAAIKSHVLGHLDTLNAGWVADVVAGMVDGVVLNNLVFNAWFINLAL